MNGFIRAASYSRVSSQRQADEHTIDSQLCDIRARATRDKIKIDPTFEYIDDGYSGTELYRPALERLRDHVAVAMIDRLYVHSPDRLARNFAHQAIVLEEMGKCGCQVLFLNHDGLPDSPETKMLIQMQGMFAEYERAKIIERTRRGRRHSAAQGNVSVFGRAPYGYRYFRKSEEGKARWEIEPTECAAVQLMFEYVGQKGASLSAVCRELQSQGIRTRTGKADWDRATVRGILVNPAYYGEAQYGKKRLAQRKPGARAKRGDPVVPRKAKVAVAAPLEEQVMIRVPEIVHKSLFEEVRLRMDENSKHQRARQNGSKHLLSGLLVCGKCGSAYCRQGGVKHHYYYRCIGADKYRRNGATVCDNKSVKGNELESCVWSDLCNLLDNPDRLQSEFDRRQSESTGSSDSIAKQKKAVNELRRRLDRLIDAYAQGLIEPLEFESRIGGLRSQHDREAAALASLQCDHSATSDPVAAGVALSALAAEVKEKLSTASYELKRNLLTLLIKRIEICLDEVRIVYKVPSNPFVRSPGNRAFSNIGCRSIWPRRLETDGSQTYFDMNPRNLRGTKTEVKLFPKFDRNTSFLTTQDKPISEASPWLQRDSIQWKRLPCFII